MIIEVGYCLFLCLDLLYMELDDANGKEKSTAKLVSILVNLGYLLYSIILTWRSY